MSRGHLLALNSAPRFSYWWNPSRRSGLNKEAACYSKFVYSLPASPPNHRWYKDPSLRSGQKLANFQHPIQGHPGPMLHFIIHGNAVNHITFHQVFHDPAKMLRGDPEHGGAQAAGIIQTDDHLVISGKLFAHAVNKMNLSPHGEAGTRGSLPN